MNLKAKAVFTGKNFAVFETALVTKLLVGAEAAANVVQTIPAIVANRLPMFFITRLLLKTRSIV